MIWHWLRGHKIRRARRRVLDQFEGITFRVSYEPLDYMVCSCDKRWPWRGRR
jgi:hypothetical protein